MANEFDQGFCPVCNGSRLKYETSNISGEMLYYDYECEDCGFRGIEWYYLVFGNHSAQDGKEINEHKMQKTSEISRKEKT